MSGGLVPASSDHGPLAAGWYSFKASYSGDDNYRPSTSECEPFKVEKAQPSLSTIIVPGEPYIAGVVVHDTAAFSSLVDGFDATGTVTYTFYKGSCTGIVQWTQDVTIGSGSSIPDSQDTDPLGAGDWAFRAYYEGDSNYKDAISDCEPFTVEKASPTVSTEAMPSSITIGEGTTPEAFDIAYLSDGFNPTGTIIFYLYMGDCDPLIPECDSVLVFTSDPVPVDGNGDYLSDPGYTPTSLGNYHWIAVYSGDENNEGYTEPWGAESEKLTVLGTIKITKYTLPGGAEQSFSFTLDGEEFELKDGESKTYTDLVLGTYTATETKPPLWTILDITCEPSDAVTVDTANGQVSIDLSKAGYVHCTYRNVRKSMVTSSSLCTFDVNPNVDGDQFRLLYTPDPDNPTFYKLTASNPGQFFYNIFTYGMELHQPMHLTITIPYPFVTQGAMPIHAYASATPYEGSHGQDCIMPGEELASWGGEGYIIELGDYPTLGDFTQTIELDIEWDHVGFVYFNIHLDYGLKGVGGWAKYPQDDDTTDAIGKTGDYTDVLIEDFFNYEFSYALEFDGEDSQIVQNQNSFKKNPGVAGIYILDGEIEDRITEGTVTLEKCTAFDKDLNCVGDWEDVATGEVDEDGYFFISHKHTGKETPYRIWIEGYPEQYEFFTMKANRFVWLGYVSVDS